MKFTLYRFWQPWNAERFLAIGKTGNYTTTQFLQQPSLYSVAALRINYYIFCMSAMISLNDQLSISSGKVLDHL